MSLVLPGVPGTVPPHPAASSRRGPRHAADRGPRSDRVVLWLVAGSIGVAALLNPKLPGHSGPADLAMVATIGAVLLWGLARRIPVRLPYAVGVVGLLVTGLVAAILSSDPTARSTAIPQEVFLFLWCAAVATVVRTPADLGLLVRAWAVSAVGWAALLVAAVVTGLRSIAGTGDRLLPGSSALQTGGGFRSRLFFDHPNMAGNYFMIAVFVLIASGYPRRRWLRVGGCLVLVAAMVLAGSNAALTAIVAGGLLTVFLQLKVRSGLIRATAVVAVLTAALGVGAVAIVPPLVTAAQDSSIRLLHDTLGRTTRSADKRQSLFESQVQLYLHGDLAGIGPNGTQDQLGAQAAAEVKEAHNDYLATLVERGPFGALALFALLAAVAVRCAAITGRRLPSGLASSLPVPGALAGACLAFAVTALTHEVLHYRWFWTLLGLVAAAHVLLRQSTARAGRSLPPSAPAMGTR